MLCRQRTPRGQVPSASRAARPSSGLPRAPLRCSARASASPPSIRVFGFALRALWLPRRRSFCFPQRPRNDAKRIGGLLWADDPGRSWLERDPWWAEDAGRGRVLVGGGSGFLLTGGGPWCVPGNFLAASERLRSARRQSGRRRVTAAGTLLTDSKAPRPCPAGRGPRPPGRVARGVGELSQEATEGCQPLLLWY
jgi:hypothetical protein